MMHPLALYAVQVHLADLHGGSRANRYWLEQARSPRKPGLSGLPGRVHPQPCSARRTPTAPLPPA